MKDFFGKHLLSMTTTTTATTTTCGRTSPSSLKTSYTDTLNTNSNTINNYLNLIQKNHENLKNSYLELERTNKKYKETIQEDLQEIKRQIRKNLTESLAKKTLIPILTFIGGVVIMGAILVGAYFLIILPYKNKELELLRKENLQLKQRIDQLDNANLQRFYQPIPTKK
ncbi:molybdopterin-guanine dinucleotide biosynthesis protein MobB [Helicobacter pylori]